MKYVIEHKLTKKPVRHRVAPYDVVTFSHSAALLFIEVKTKIMGANFYNIIEIKPEVK